VEVRVQGNGGENTNIGKIYILPAAENSRTNTLPKAYAVGYNLSDVGQI